MRALETRETRRELTEERTGVRSGQEHADPQANLASVLVEVEHVLAARRERKVDEGGGIARWPRESVNVLS